MFTGSSSIQSLFLTNSITTMPMQPSTDCTQDTEHLSRRRSRKRPRPKCGGILSSARHVFTGALLLSFVGRCNTSHAGGGRGADRGRLGSAYGDGQPDSFDIDEWQDWTAQSGPAVNSPAVEGSALNARESLLKLYMRQQLPSSTEHEGIISEMRRRARQLILAYQRQRWRGGTIPKHYIHVAGRTRTGATRKIGGQSGGVNHHRLPVDTATLSAASTTRARSTCDASYWVEDYSPPILTASPPHVPFGPPVTRYVERPEALDGVRALALVLEDEDRRELSRYVAMILQKLANMNEIFLGTRVRKDTVFHSSAMPSVAVAEFVERVANNIQCPNLCLMLTLVYMDRLALPSSELHLYVTPLSAHRLFTASLIIAIKFIADGSPSVFNDRFYERMNAVTGLAVAELKHLEHHMLQALAKDACVSVADVKRYMVAFDSEQHEVIPYVDQPYSGPPLFPFQ